MTLACASAAAVSETDGLTVGRHPAGGRLLDVKMGGEPLAMARALFDKVELLDLEYKPFLRFELADNFDRLFGGGLGTLLRAALQDRDTGALLVRPENADEWAGDSELLVKLSTALSHLAGPANFDDMAGKYYARFEVRFEDDSDSYLRKAWKKLDLHTDGTYVRERTDWLLMMKMREENADGGESVLLHLDDWEECGEFFAEPAGRQNFLWGSPRSKNVGYTVEHPVFSADAHGRPLIAYIDQFPQPQTMEQGLFLARLSRSMENSGGRMVFDLPPGGAIVSNNHFMLHGREAFRPAAGFCRELLRQRGVFYADNFDPQQGESQWPE